MRISDWSSDVCSSDLVSRRRIEVCRLADPLGRPGRADAVLLGGQHTIAAPLRIAAVAAANETVEIDRCARSEEHTSELQSLMRISYAVFCLKKKNIN